MYTELSRTARKIAVMSNKTPIRRQSKQQQSTTKPTEQEIRLAVDQIEQRIKTIQRQRFIDGPLTTEEKVFHHKITNHIKQKNSCNE